MVKKIVLACLALFLLVPVCLAADLDAPAQKPVTVRSEIQRGHEAIWGACVDKGNPISMDNAISAVLNRNKQNNTDTDAFLLGAYYASTELMGLSINFKGITDNQIKVGKSALSFYYKHFREQQEKLSLSDQQLAEALGLNYDIMKKDLDNWESQINATATSP